MIAKVLRNIVADPTNQKLRKLRLGNPKIKAAIMDTPGGLEYLQVQNRRCHDHSWFLCKCFLKCA